MAATHQDPKQTADTKREREWSHPYIRNVFNSFFLCVLSLSPLFFSPLLLFFIRYAALRIVSYRIEHRFLWRLAKCSRMNRVATLKTLSLSLSLAGFASWSVYQQRPARREPFSHCDLRTLKAKTNLMCARCSCWNGFMRRSVRVRIRTLVSLLNIAAAAAERGHLLSADNLIISGTRQRNANLNKL